MADPDVRALDQMLASAIVYHEGAQLNKLVELDGESEAIELGYDTMTIKKDLKTLMEFPLARLITPTNYNKIKKEVGMLFERKEKEKKGPVSVFIGKNLEGKLNTLEIKFTEENYLYKSDQIINVKFDKEKMIGYKIIGNRKLIGLDPSNYRIEVSVEYP